MNLRHAPQVASAVVLALAMLAASAQNYPSRPVRIVTPPIEPLSPHSIWH